MNFVQNEPERGANLRDVAYGPLERNRLDVYPAPTGDKAAPVILFFHGGSWRKGDKRLYRWLGRALARRGFTAVIPNYRLFPEAGFPAFMEDAALVVAWTRESVARYGGDPHQIHVMGHSAGAHIAALLALDEVHLSGASLSPEALRSVIGLAGPYCMDPMKTESVRPVFECVPDPGCAMPVKWAHRKGPPMLLLHGGRDSTVPSRQSELFHTVLTKNGGEVRKIIYPGIGHIEILLTLTPVYRWRAPVFRDVVTFLRNPADAEPAAAAESPLEPMQGRPEASGV